MGQMNTVADNPLEMRGMEGSVADTSGMNPATLLSMLGGMGKRPQAPAANAVAPAQDANRMAILAQMMQNMRQGSPGGGPVTAPTQTYY